MNKRAFGQRLKQSRKDQNFTSDKLAEKCDMNPVFVRQIESGIRLPSIENFILLCNAIQVSPAYLLGADLKYDEQDEVQKLAMQIRALSPKQFEMVQSTLKAMIDCME